MKNTAGHPGLRRSPRRRESRGLRGASLPADARERVERHESTRRGEEGRGKRGTPDGALFSFLAGENSSIEERQRERGNADSQQWKVGRVLGCVEGREEISDRWVINPLSILLSRACSNKISRLLLEIKFR